MSTQTSFSRLRRRTLGFVRKFWIRGCDAAATWHMPVERPRRNKKDSKKFRKRQAFRIQQIPQKAQRMHVFSCQIVQFLLQFSHTKGTR